MGITVFPALYIFYFGWKRVGELTQLKCLLYDLKKILRQKIIIYLNFTFKNSISKMVRCLKERSLR
ncbi:hypothetical protein P872_12600 [Rhodonellum psychrophilum GCM71 = DSM 17998]|uniref:Uncharacterized protein n=1 Tax=Rhodonellum psychrophilum GCM71 = DSM 17998 TaxID=1123057 RepID=U5BXG6_9BACT|nr:hypothetical protein P872_12600 [Rhodonellum psychrophilum GCM71 = DSM 17998]